MAIAMIAIAPAIAQVAPAQPSGGKPQAKSPAETGGQDLSSQATDPTASLMAMNIISDFTTSYWDGDDSGYTLKFQPVVPFKAWGKSNILRLIVPYQASGPGDEGLKSVSIFDLVILPQKWGRFGIGPVMSLSESGSDASSTFAIGPAVGAVHPVSKRLNIGLFTQNLFADSVAITQLQPIVAFQLGHGWALSAGDLQFTYDWKQGEWTSIPLGAQLGVVQRLGTQPFRFAVNPQWNVRHIEGSDKFKIVVTVTLLAPSG